MRKTIKFIVVLIFLFKISLTKSQNPFPIGTYLTFLELKNKMPSQIDTFNILKRSQFDIIMMGGNDYEVKSISKTKKIKKKFIKKKIFAISTGDSLYINCYRRNIQSKYAITKFDENLLVFKASSPEDDIGGFAFGAIGGAIGGTLTGAQAALKRYLYVMDLNDGKVSILTNSTLIQFLYTHKDLYNKYMDDKEKINDEILLNYYKEYLKRINK